MKSKVLIILSGIIVILFLGGSSFQSSNKEAVASSKSIINFADEKSNEDTCPFLQQKNKSNCPYLNESIEGSKSSCPYLSGVRHCPYLNKDINVESCPYLKKESGEEIKNSST